MPFSLKAWIVIALAILLYSLIFQFIKYTGYRLRQTRSLQKDKYKYVKHFLKTLVDVFAVFIQQPSADTRSVVKPFNYYFVRDVKFLF